MLPRHEDDSTRLNQRISRWISQWIIQWKFLSVATMVLICVSSHSETTAHQKSTAIPRATQPQTLPEPTGNSQISEFDNAKRLAFKIHEDHAVTLYCGCHYSGRVVDVRSCGYQVQSDPKRATRVEWEHVVPAEAFGQSFKEWREGDPIKCVKKNGRKYKGRKCAQKNSEFGRMEADLYNLWPEIGELNNLRANFSMAQITGSARTFGGCQAKIQDRKFEPMDRAKGIVARVYMYMDSAYPGRGIISKKNRPLFEVWDKRFPVTLWECERAERIKQAQGNENHILASRCRTLPKK